jgi:hypothetical protein
MSSVCGGESDNVIYIPLVEYQYQSEYANVYTIRTEYDDVGGATCHNCDDSLVFWDEIVRMVVHCCLIPTRLSWIYNALDHIEI